MAFESSSFATHPVILSLLGNAESEKKIITVEEKLKMSYVGTILDMKTSIWLPGSKRVLQIYNEAPTGGRITKIVTN